jgi:cytochrome P450
MLVTKMPIHRGKNLLGISVGFIRNPALFTIEEGFEKGDFYKVTLPGYNLFIVTDPKIIHHIMIANEASYAKGKMYWKQLRAIIGRAMGSLEGDEWLFLRKLENPFFTKTKIKTYLSDVVKITRKHLNKWQVGEEKELEVVSLISRINTEIVLKTIFGLDAEFNYEQIAAKIGDGQETISWRSGFPWRPMMGWLNGRNQRAKKHLAFFDDYTEKSISIAKNDKNFDANKNLLNRLIAEPSILQKDIRNELIVHLGASTETAAVGKAWTLYLLARHPKTLEKVRSEIAEVANNEELTGESAFQLLYTEQVVKESLRLYPPSYANTRDCIQADEIWGIKIKKGDSFFISLIALHRHPKYWEQPNEFIPERFAPENAHKIHPNTYHPYGVGKHHCIGRYFATPMMVLMIAEICRRFDFELVEKEEKKPLSLSTLKPENGMQIRFFERK